LGPNHLTAQEVCQCLLFKQYWRTCFRHRIYDFSWCFFPTVIVDVVWEVGQEAHFEETSRVLAAPCSCMKSVCSTRTKYNVL